MANTPISRIPLDGMTEQGVIDAEEALKFESIGDALDALTAHEGRDEHLSITLDWAMQLRERTGSDWATCVSTAIIAYFG